MHKLSILCLQLIENANKMKKTRKIKIKFRNLLFFNVYLNTIKNKNIYKLKIYI